ncbi:MAG: hypothetical protein Q9207_007659 [Kuettlingeria erythrocarpa]
MYLSLVLLLAGSDYCGSLPQPKEATAHLGLENEPVQYPDQYLPFNISSVKETARTSGGQINNISFPLDPRLVTTIQSKITYTQAPARPPEGGQLITSLLAAIITCWLDGTNQPITQKMQTNYLPFTHIRHWVEPASAPGKILTVYTVGIIYCEMLRGLFQQPPWPGHAHAEIFHVGAGPLTSRFIGDIDIVAVPTSSAVDQALRAKKAPFPHLDPNLSLRIGNRPANNSTDQTPTMLRSEPVDEKVWLDLFSRLMFWIFQHSWDMRLSQSLVAGPYRFLSLIDNTTWLILTITPYAVAPGAPFKWVDLMGVFIPLLVQAAIADKWEALYGVELRHSGILIAWLSIHGRSSGGEDGEGSSGITTA